MEHVLTLVTVNAHVMTTDEDTGTYGNVFCQMEFATLVDAADWVKAHRPWTYDIVLSYITNQPGPDDDKPSA